ncbi:MAG: VCBS repeat-containing protein [Nannocystaceae bacterium]
MKSSSGLGMGTPVVLGLLLLAGCGRTGLGPFIDEEVSDGSLDGAEVEEPGVGFGDDGDEDEPPNVDPPPEATCGNGVIDPGEICFLPQVTFYSRIDPCALDVGDFDGDGNLDVVTPNSDFDHLESPLNITSVLYGDGQGRLSEPVPYVSGDDIPVGVRVGDLDGSGTLDVVVINSDAGSLSLMLNGGQQQIEDAGRLGVGEMPVMADVGDLDGDGVLDVAVTALDEVLVSRGRGDGSFEPPVSLSFPGMPWQPRLLDIDRDGNLDLLASNAISGRLFMWRGNGTGELLEYGGLATNGTPLGFTPADVNADGIADLLIAHSFGLGVMLGDGEGGFLARQDVEAGVEPRAVAAADFDGDGRLDAAVANAASQDVTLVIGSGDGSFDYAATYTVGTLPSGIAAGDFNRDGVPDIAVSNQLSNNIGLILSNP